MTPDLRAYSINRVGASIDTLLNLQACDVKRINAQHRLEKAPLELEAQQKKVQQEKDALEDGQGTRHAVVVVGLFIVFPLVQCFLLIHLLPMQQNDYHDPMIQYQYFQHL